MTFDNKVAINVALSNARTAAIKHWLDALELGRISDFWAENLREVNDAQAAFQASGDGRY